MQVELVHCLPERVRIRVPGLCGRPRLLAVLADTLARVPGMRSVRPNPWSATLLLTFDGAQVTAGRLLRMLSGQVRQEVAATSEAAPVAGGSPSPPPDPPTDQAGLTRDEVTRRRERFGRNILPARPISPFFRRFLSQFTSLSTIVLVAGAVLSLLTGRVWEVFAVGAAAGLNAIIGAWREGQGDEIVEPLQALNPPHAVVVREGRSLTIPAADLVPGDVVLLSAGDVAPADVMILTASDLEADDSRLAGNDSDTVGPRTFIASQLLPAGSEILQGHATGVVTATGAATYLGRIAQNLGHLDRLPSPVERRTARLARDLLRLSVMGLGIVLGAGLLRGVPPLQLLESVVSIIAAAVPEGLPTFLTLALAAGARRLARREAYVRELSVAEGIGTVDVICTDKTGTLTRGEMTVRNVFTGNTWWSVGGTGMNPKGRFLRDGEPAQALEDPDMRAFLDVAVRCNQASLIDVPGGGLSIEGSPTEGALLILALKAGLPRDFGQEPRLAEEAFAPRRRRMTVTVGIDGAPLTCSKGAPEAILPACNRIMADGNVRMLTEDDLTAIRDAVTDIVSGGQRVLALAYSYGNDNRKQGLIFAGLAGIVDPPRTELRPLLRRAYSEGIRTIMLTGDHPQTALVVARELGLLRRSRDLLTGADLDDLDGKQLAHVLRRVRVFARVTPEQKARIIRALQKQGHTVACVGDGLDDALAVRTADIGAAPSGRAAEVTRAAAGVILADDRLETLLTAIRQGRSTAGNTDDIARYLLTANIAELLLLVAAAAFGLPLPLLPVHLLWLNVIADGPPAIALGERHTSEPGVAPRKRAELPRREILLHGLELGAAAFGLYVGALAGGGSVAIARSLALSTLAVSQILYLFRCRTQLNTPCGIRFPDEPIVTLAAAASGMLLLGTLYFPPLALALGTAPLGFSQWLAVVGAALAVNLTAVAGFSLKRQPEVAPAFA